MNKRVLSLILTFFMIIAILPVALASEDFVIADGRLTSYKGTGGHVVIPDGVTHIEAAAFANCESLTYVVIPKTVTRIGDYAFRGCKSLTSVVIPDSVRYIGYEAFQDCESLTAVTVPIGVTYIGRETFGGCKSLTSVYLHSNVTYINDSAFAGCESLTIYAEAALHTYTTAKKYANDNGIPIFGTYTVRHGDTLISIAKRFNTTWYAILKWNDMHIKDPDYIYQGQRLIVSELSS